MQVHRQCPVFDPVTVDLTDAINAKCENAGHTKQECLARLNMELPSMRRYCKKYGRTLENVLFVIDDWLSAVSPMGIDV